MWAWLNARSRRDELRRRHDVWQEVQRGYNAASKQLRLGHPGVGAADSAIRNERMAVLKAEWDAAANAAIPPDEIPISWAHFGILTHIITATTLAEEVAGYWKQGSVLLIGIALSTAGSIVSLFATA